MPMNNQKSIFFASFMTLIAAGMGFAIRGGILNDWGTQYGFTKLELGTITGGGLVGFGIVIPASMVTSARGSGLSTRPALCGRKKSALAGHLATVVAA